MNTFDLILLSTIIANVGSIVFIGYKIEHRLTRLETTVELLVNRHREGDL